VVGITAAILAVEVIGAVVSGSLALLADAGHMLTDAAGLSLALVAEVLAAAAQAAVLLAVGGLSWPRRSGG
jgi:cobalt-zinc-cadmium efflux system protein